MNAQSLQTKLDRLDALEDALIEFKEGRISKDELLGIEAKTAPKVERDAA